MSDGASSLAAIEIRSSLLESRISGSFAELGYHMYILSRYVHLCGSPTFSCVTPYLLPLRALLRPRVLHELTTCTLLHTVCVAEPHLRSCSDCRYFYHIHIRARLQARIQACTHARMHARMHDGTHV